MLRPNTVGVVKGVLKVVMLDVHGAVASFNLFCTLYNALVDEIKDLTDIQDNAEG